MTNFTPIAVNAAGSHTVVNAPFTELSGIIDDIRNGEITVAGAATIVGGILYLGAATHSLITLSAESGTTDNLDQIAGGELGQVLYLRAASGDTITVRHDQHNILDINASSVSLSGSRILPLIKTSGKWSTFEPEVKSGVLVNHVEFNDAVTQIDFNNIPAFNGTLRLIFGFRSDAVASVADFDFRLNGYSIAAKSMTVRHYYNSLTRNELLMGSAQVLRFILPGGLAPASALSGGVLDIFNIGSGSPVFMQYRGVLYYSGSTSNIYTIRSGALTVSGSILRVSSLTLSALTNGYSNGFYALYAIGS